MASLQGKAVGVENHKAIHVVVLTFLYSLSQVPAQPGGSQLVLQDFSKFPALYSNSQAGQRCDLAWIRSAARKHLRVGSQVPQTTLSPLGRCQRHGPGWVEEERQR